LAKGRLESERYAATHGFEVHEDRVAYEQDGDPLIDGYEVWSDMFQSPETLADFYVNRYLKYEYHPEL
jgi:hypothetical protein